MGPPSEAGYGEVGQIQRMSHLVAEDIRCEILWRAFKFKVKRVGKDAIHCHGMVDRVVWEILHVGPEDGSPCARTAFHDETHIVDKTVAVAVKRHVVINEVVFIDILESTCQQLGLTTADSNKWIFTSVSYGIRGAVRLEIATRHLVLI